MGLEGLGLCLFWTGATGQKSTDSALPANEKCHVTKPSQALTKWGLIHNFPFAGFGPLTGAGNRRKQGLKTAPDRTGSYGPSSTRSRRNLVVFVPIGALKIRRAVP
jgi:hypothetical protein